MERVSEARHCEVSRVDNILFECKIPGRARILKNSRKLIRVKSTGRMIPVSSDRYKRWEVFASAFISRNFKCRTIDFPVNLSVKFYFKDHSHEPDLSNALQGIEDILQKVGVIKNDKLIHSLNGSQKVFGSSTEYIEVVLSKI